MNSKESQTKMANMTADENDYFTKGLSDEDVEERKAAGKVNEVRETVGRSYWDIIRANVFSLFNAILGTLFIIIISVGSIKDGLFGLVLVANTMIGLAQEIRAKITLERLSLLTAPRSSVIRNGKSVEIASSEVVLDEIIQLKAGDQLIVDGVVLFSDSLEIDESLLTGESVPISKSIGDRVLSGSFVSAGTGAFRATEVGEDAYARTVAKEAKQFKTVHSELYSGINKILKYITWILFPVGALLFFSQYRAEGGVKEAMVGMVGGLVGMIPEGLVLLTSVAFAVSAVSLARRKCLIQSLPAVEGLARVDVVCMDKTGTITEGTLEFADLEPLSSRTDLPQALGAVAANTPGGNATVDALSDYFEEVPDWKFSARVPFSSARKWSSVSFDERGSWILGAPEILLDENEDKGVLERVNDIASEGKRVILLSYYEKTLEEETLPEGMKHEALLTFEEKMRADAASTVEYFFEQNVAVKVISGDNPVTVGAVARRAGVEFDGDAVDARYLPEDADELSDVIERSSVFGRVTPHQKRAMVAALQSKGHTVAMTGDGVNDTLALKDADIGIAMGSGAASTKSVAEIVLLDGKFSVMPGVVAEGRRVIGNVERVANLFITKTTYAVLLAIFIGFLAWPYVFLPRHLTIVSTVSIGTPAFFLSLARNTQLYRPGFVKRVLKFAIPAGTVIALAVITTYAFARIQTDYNVEESKTVATLVLAVLSLFVLSALSKPLASWRGGLVAAMVGLFVLVLSVPYGREFFELHIPQWTVMLEALIVTVIGIVILEIIWRLIGRKEVERT